MSNTGDNPIRRAAGIMAWKLMRGGTQQEAVAKAAAREVELTEAQLRYALDWAQAAIALGELLRQKGHGKTLAELKGLTGVSFFADRANHPPYHDEVTA